MNINRKFTREGQNETNSELDLFKSRETGNLMYKTPYGIPVELVTKQNINSLLPYKSYTVSLSQQTIDPPEVEVEFENTLEVTATYTRITNGDYLVTFDKPIFNSPYDYAVIHQNTFVDAIGVSLVVGAIPLFFNVLSITTYNTGTLADEVISTFTGPCILEIRVYNQ